MLSCTNSWLKNETHQCKQYVEELAVFHDKAVQNSQHMLYSLSAELSMFCTPGISQAYRFVFVFFCILFLFVLFFDSIIQSR